MFYYGLLLPVVIVILHNLLTSVFVVHRLLTSRHSDESCTDKIKVEKISHRMQNAWVISVVIGVTLVFGFLAIDEVQMSYQLLFSVCTSLQGLLVLVLFCMRDDDVRKAVLSIFNHGGRQPCPDTDSSMNINNSSNYLRLAQHNTATYDYRRPRR